MAQLKQPGRESELRDWLLAEAEDFRRMHVETQLDDPVWARYVWDETSKAVDRLAGGAAHPLHRWQLPFDHPAREVGSIHDSLELGVDDVLRPADTVTPARSF